MTYPVPIDTDPAELQLAALMNDVVAEAARLYLVLPVAYSQQWQGNEADPQLQHADPTGNVATDSARLALRLEIIRAERALTHAALTLRAARANVSKAIR